MNCLRTKEVTKEEVEMHIKAFPDDDEELIRVGDHGYLFSVTFLEGLNKIHNMPVRPSDVFVVSFPRSGTTWTQEMVWMIENNLDYNTSKATSLHERYSFIEYPLITLTNQIKELRYRGEDYTSIQKEFKMSSLEILATAPDPRFFKTHLPLSLLPPDLLATSKVIYVARDPRDAAVSRYHLKKLMNKAVKYTGNFKDYWNLFLHDLIRWSPIFEHTKEAWKMRNHPNLLFIFYEEMSKDLPSVIRKVSTFFGKDYNEDQIRDLANHLDIESFKKNKSVQSPLLEKGLLNNEEEFIRKGKVGGWREYFDAEMTRQAEEWMSRNLQDTDLRYPSS